MLLLVIVYLSVVHSIPPQLVDGRDVLWDMHPTCFHLCSFLPARAPPPVVLLLLLVVVFVVVAAASIVVALRRGEYPLGEGADGIVIRRPRLPPPRPPPLSRPSSSGRRRSGDCAAVRCRPIRSSIRASVQSSRTGGPRGSAILRSASRR